MKKAVLAAAVFVIITVLLCINALAADGGMTERLGRNIPESVKDIFDERSVTDMDTDGILDKILGKAKDAFGAIFKDTLKNAVVLISTVIFCSLASAAADKKDGAPDYVLLVGAATVISAAVTGKGAFLQPALSAAEDLDMFSKVLLPTMTSLSAGSGAVTSAAVRFAASSLFMDILISAVRNMIIPLIYVFTAASAAAAVFGGDALKSAAGFVKKLVYIFLSGITVAFTVYLTITGVVASSADAAAVKLTKTAMSSLIPVVGRLISDAADSVVSGISILRNTAGVFGILVICAVCAVPFLRLSANWMIYKILAAFTGSISGKELSGLMENIGTAFGMALAAVAAEAAMLFISVISFIKMNL